MNTPAATSTATPAAALPRWARDPIIEALAGRAATWAAAQSLVLEDLCLALPVSWAVVRDAQGRRALGTALTPVGEGSADAALHEGLPPDWRDWPLPTLAARLAGTHPYERCLALAAINALSQHRLAGQLQAMAATPIRGGIVRWVAEQRPDRLVMIGNMQPLAEGFAKAGIAHWIFERNPANRRGVQPNVLDDAQEWAWLPEADGLVVTGAALLNHSLAPMLALARRARFVALVGFSAQAHPEFLAGSGLTHVFSMRFADIDAMRRQLQVGNWNAMFATEGAYMLPVAA